MGKQFGDGDNDVGSYGVGNHEIFDSGTRYEIMLSSATCGVLSSDVIDHSMRFYRKLQIVREFGCLLVRV